MDLFTSCPSHWILGLFIFFVVLLIVAVVITLKYKTYHKKIFSAVSLILAVLPLQWKGATTTMSEGTEGFLITSVLLFVMSLVLILIQEYKNKEASNPGKKSELEENSDNKLLNFIRLFLSRFFVGEMLTSIYGLFLFVLFAMTLTQWLPNAIQYSQPLFTIATVLYVIDIILISAWVYGPLTDRKESPKPPEVKYLIYALSSPVGFNQKINWDVNRIKAADCADLRKDTIRINIVPLYVSIHHNFSGLEKLFLLYSNTHKVKKNPTIDGLRAFFEKASECLQQDYGECVSFKVHWEEIFPGEGTGSIPRTECKRTIEVHFVYIGSANDVMEIYNKLRKDPRLTDLLEKHRKDVLFHITGGTAVISAAMVLHAIKKDVRAEYLRQDAAGREPDEALREIDIDLFEDLGDIVRELRDYFEK